MTTIKSLPGNDALRGEENKERLQLSRRLSEKSINSPTTGSWWIFHTKRDKSNDDVKASSPDGASSAKFYCRSESLLPSFLTRKKEVYDFHSPRLSCSRKICVDNKWKCVKSFSWPWWREAADKITKQAAKVLEEGEVYQWVSHYIHDNNRKIAYSIRQRFKVEQPIKSRILFMNIKQKLRVIHLAAEVFMTSHLMATIKCQWGKFQCDFNLRVTIAFQVTTSTDFPRSILLILTISFPPHLLILRVPKRILKHVFARAAKNGNSKVHWKAHN